MTIMQADIFRKELSWPSCRSYKSRKSDSEDRRDLTQDIRAVKKITQLLYWSDD